LKEDTFKQKEHIILGTLRWEVTYLGKFGKSSTQHCRLGWGDMPKAIVFQSHHGLQGLTLPPIIMATSEKWVYLQ